MSGLPLNNSGLPHDAERVETALYHRRIDVDRNKIGITFNMLMVADALIGTHRDNIIDSHERLMK